MVEEGRGLIGRGEEERCAIEVSCRNATDTNKKVINQEDIRDPKTPTTTTILT